MEVYWAFFTIVSTTNLHTTHKEHACTRNVRHPASAATASSGATAMLAMHKAAECSSWASIPAPIGSLARPRAHDRRTACSC